MGKEKEEERKDNASTKSQNHQKNSGQVDLGNDGQNNLGMLNDWYTADSNSQTSAAKCPESNSFLTGWLAG